MLPLASKQQSTANVQCTDCQDAVSLLEKKKQEKLWGVGPENVTITAMGKG